MSDRVEVWWSGNLIGHMQAGTLEPVAGVTITTEHKVAVMHMLKGDGLGPQFKDHNVRHIPATTTLSAEQALHHSLQDNLTDVIVIGYYKDSTLSVKSSRMSRAEALFMLEKAKDHIMGRN